MTIIHWGANKILVDEGAAVEDEVEAYLATGESIGKAGGLCVQGDGRRFVESIEGEEAVIVGLPLQEILNYLGH